MNQLQQEIKDFHDKIRPTLERVLAQFDKDAPQRIYHHIIRPCKRLIQKCSFKSCSDTSSLCSLAYWLYIYGQKELALELCELTHGVAFEPEYRDSGIQNIYGLEIRLARELLGEERKGIIPPEMLEHFFSKRVRKELRYPQILREEQIAACSGSFLNIELLYALYNMIGKGETGLYAELNKNWDKIEETITEYIGDLEKE